MRNEAEKQRRRIVLDEVGVGQELEITDPARLFRILASRKNSNSPQQQEAARLISLAEQLEERGVR